MTTTTTTTTVSQKLSDRLIAAALAEPLSREAGAAEALRRYWVQANRTGTGGNRVGLQLSAVSRLLTALSERPKWTGPHGFVHPWTIAERDGRAAYRRLKGETPEPLSAADVLWLQRLPLDPNAVTFDDAVRVASLAKAHTDVMTSDGRLISSIAAPIKEVHDARQAETDLQLARRAMPPVPYELREALDETLALEEPDVPADVRESRIDTRIREAIQTRDDERNRTLWYAQQAADAVRQRTTDRNATTRAVGA